MAKKHIHQESPIRSQQAMQVDQVCLSTLGLQTVIATHVQDQVEWARQVLKAGDIIDAEIYIHISLAGFAACLLNGTVGEVHASCLPAVVRQGDYIGSGAAPQVQGAPGRMARDKVYQLRRGNAGIPGRFPVVPQVEG